MSEEVIPVSPLGAQRPRAIFVYTNDGEIVATCGPATDEMIKVYQDEGMQFVVGEQSDEVHSTFFVEDGELRRKDPIAVEVTKLEIAADGVDDAEITGIPEGATITVTVAGQRVTHDATGEPVSITSDTPAEYQIEISKARMIPLRFKVVAK